MVDELYTNLDHGISDVFLIAGTFLSMELQCSELLACIQLYGPVLWTSITCTLHLGDSYSAYLK